MYIFKYVKKDGTLIGYHLSTFCQVGDKEQAKRYGCTPDTVDKQLEVIQNNIKNILKSTPDGKGLFDGLKNQIREDHFNGLTFDDISVEPEYLTDGVQPDDIEYRIHTIADADGIKKVDIPMDSLPQVINELNQKKNN